MQHVRPLLPCELDHKRGDSRQARHDNVFDVIMPAIPKHVWDHNVWVGGKLIEEERFLVQTGPGTQTMWSLDLQHDAVVKHIGARLPTGLINAGDCRATHAMATHNVKHRPLIQHRVNSIGPGVYVTG